ncbi:MAG: metallophosphoesterase family protein [Vicinamibacteria bacterium]
MTRRGRLAAVAVLASVLPLGACGGAGGSGASPSGATLDASASLPSGTEAFAGTVVLGSPTASSIRVNVLASGPGGTASVLYGTSRGAYAEQTGPRPLAAGAPLEILLEGLKADTAYYYRVRLQATDGRVSATDEASFRTPRAPGSTFTFCLQGDSHPEREKTQFDAELYRRTLQTAAADQPDFYLTMGDDFSVDTLDPATIDASRVAERYTLQRPFLSIVGRAAPLFLVNGNHEQAARYLLDGTPNNVAVWAQNARNALYSQPAPDGFYTGDAESVPHVGLLRNYFAWTWGDALFVVIDPYWSSPVCIDEPFGGGPKRSNLWDVTHGEAQYQWLRSTLEQSRARWKFVFAHHVLGTGRGGVELADGYEWGGRGGNGSWGFAANRPGWAAPIHALLAASRVTVFFQGHDHVWVRQEADGVVYQTLSEPADPHYTLYNADAYRSGDKLPNTGYTRVSVSPSAVDVAYVRTYLPADEGAGRTNGAVAFRYSIR